MLYRFLITTLLLLPLVTAAQHIVPLVQEKNISIRGLSVVNDRVVWVSGSAGTVGRSLDSGKTWTWMQVKGFEKTDFRDIEAFDGASAIIMGVGSPAYILKTVNGGTTWKLVFEDQRAGMFLDAMEFWNEQSGIVIGDPIDSKFFIARTFDEGNTWQTLPDSLYPTATTGEALFAASGTNIRALSLSEAAFVTGGNQSRIFIRNERYALPLASGTTTTGANSLAIYNKTRRKQPDIMIVVGGDFAAKDISAGNCAISKNGGKSWVLPNQPPLGYKSCVEFINRRSVITCGTSGVDISRDGGMNWISISKEAYHVCRKAKDGHIVYLAGPDGKIAKLVW